MLAAYDDKRAYALCSFAFTPGIMQEASWLEYIEFARQRMITCLDNSTGPNAEPIVFVGRTDGMIVPARGKATFGWGKA